MDVINQINTKNGEIDINKFNNVVKKYIDLKPFLIEYKRIADDIIKKNEAIIKRINNKNLQK